MLLNSTPPPPGVQRQGLNVLDLIQQYAPREWRTSSNLRSAYTMRCPIHDGKGFNFSVSEDGQLWKCWTRCGGGNAYQLLQLLTGAERPLQVSAPPKPQPKPQTPVLEKEYPIFQGATIVELATAKGLNPEYLRDVLGW